MGRTYSAKRGTSSYLGPKQFTASAKRCGFEPGTWKSMRGEVHTNYDKFKLKAVV
jgi:hypothetical protein